MAFKLFKKKEGTGRAGKKAPKKPNVEAVAESAVSETQRAPAQDVEKTRAKRQKGSADSYENLRRPHVTEKATMLAERKQYTFVVVPHATKHGVKNSVQDFYGVEVTGVRMIHVPAKKIRVGKIKGIKKGYKKAIVKLKEGQSIEILPR